MNNIRIFSLLIFAAYCHSCEQENTSANVAEATLEGSWELVRYVPHAEGKSDWTVYGDSIVYQKHLSPDHFIWFKYDATNDRILAMGGGTYLIKDDKYVENIKFFYPPGSSERGQTIPFNFSLENNEWSHVGHSKIMAVNMESGKLEVIDSTKIEEIWKRTDIGPNQNTGLVGTWDMISYRDSLNGEYTEYPDFVEYFKLLTPTHFTWIYYDKYGDEIYAAGSGRYQFDGKKYTEVIDMLYPDNFGQLGSTIDFKIQINNNTWKHVGYFPNPRVDHTNGHIIRDSSLIDEKWHLHEASVMDGILF